MKTKLIVLFLCITSMVSGYSVTTYKNFSGQATPSIVTIGYESCNFSQVLPDPNLPNKVRIFPGDDTPRIFYKCNLVNCEVPPGSTVYKCNTSIIAHNILIGSITITVDGKSSSIEFFGTKFYRDSEWHIVDSIPSIPAQVIDTTEAQYVNLLTGIELWRDLMRPRLRLFTMASDAQRKQWWTNDPLLKATLLLLRDGAEFIERLEGLDE